MNNTLEENSEINERNLLTISVAAKLLWEVRKYRNKVFWTSVYRYGATALALTIAPYLLPDLIGKLGFAVFVFPIMASLLSVFTAYLTAVQYRLYKQADIKYRSLLGIYNWEDIPNNKPINRLLRIGMGKIVVLVFLCFAVIGEFFNGLVLLFLVRSVLP